MRHQKLIILIFLSFSSHRFPKVSTSEEISCELFTDHNFEGEPVLALRDSDIINDVDLVIADANNNGSSHKPIKSIRLQASKLLTCTQPKLKGKCSEHSENVPKFGQEFKSAACKGSGMTNRVARKLEYSTACGALHEKWYYSGQSQNLLFSGSASKLGFDTVESALVKSGCKVTLWRQHGDKMSSLTFEDSITFIRNYANKEMAEETPETYEWSCCYCDTDSEKVCENAKNITLLQQAEEVDDKDFSQFVEKGKKIIGIGRNYRWKVSELAKVLKVPEKPIVFMKPTTSYIVEGESIKLPKSLGTIFYEIELGVVIGKRGKLIPNSLALDHVAGYFLALDMTAKEFLKKSLNHSLPWEIGKGFDTACPVSEFIPKHLIPDPDNVDISALINGKLTQSDNTRNMIFNVSSLISYVSKYITLEPYDTLLTGTPDGLGPIQGGDVIEGMLGNLTRIRFDVVNFNDD